MNNKKLPISKFKQGTAKIAETETLTASQNQNLDWIYRQWWNHIYTSKLWNPLHENIVYWLYYYDILMNSILESSFARYVVGWYFSLAVSCTCVLMVDKFLYNSFMNVHFDFLTRPPKTKRVWMLGQIFLLEILIR